MKNAQMYILYLVVILSLCVLSCDRQRDTPTNDFSTNMMSDTATHVAVVHDDITSHHHKTTRLPDMATEDVLGQVDDFSAFLTDFTFTKEYCSATFFRVAHYLRKHPEKWWDFRLELNRAAREAPEDCLRALEMIYTGNPSLEPRIYIVYKRREQMALRHLGRHQEAYDVIQKVLEGPHSELAYRQGAHISQSLIAYRLGNLERAIEDAKKDYHFHRDTVFDGSDERRRHENMGSAAGELAAYYYELQDYHAAYDVIQDALVHVKDDFISHEELIEWQKELLRHITNNAQGVYYEKTHRRSLMCLKGAPRGGDNSASAP